MIDDDALAFSQIVATARLILRLPSPEDAEPLVALANNPAVSSMLSSMPHPYRQEDAMAFLLKAQSPGRRVWAVTRASDGAFLGCAGYSPFEDILEIGYWIGEPHWGQGYATEAAHAVVDQAFALTASTALHAECRMRNAASRRVIHKCGFQYAGQGMRMSLASGRIPVERYRLDRTIWKGLRSWPAQSSANQTGK
ncbi:MAG: GNAT family N-acetyltransferase [Rhizobiaceae bacterium]